MNHYFSQNIHFNFINSKFKYEIQNDKVEHLLLGSNSTVIVTKFPFSTLHGKYEHAVNAMEIISSLLPKINLKNHH